jgi:hypothetical protein
MQPLPTPYRPGAAVGLLLPAEPTVVNPQSRGLTAPAALLDGLRQAIRVRLHAMRTEDTCVDWLRRLIRVRRQASSD